MPTKASRKAKQAGDSASLELVARAGLIAYGVVHLLIGWLAVQIAWNASDSKSADTSWALKTLADQPFGKFLLWLVAVGLAALALWQASEAFWGYRNRQGAERVRKQLTSAAAALIYAALGGQRRLVRAGLGIVELAVPEARHLRFAGVARRTGDRGGRRPDHHRRRRGPPGQGAKEVLRRGDRHLLDVSRRSQGRGASGPNRIHRQGGRPGPGGRPAQLRDADLRPAEARLDGAMQTILAQPFGRFLLTAAALGFLALGVFTILQSRFRRM